MITPRDGYTFDLTIKRYGVKQELYMGSQYNNEKEPEILEELQFSSLSPVDAMRKLLDYIK